MLGFLIFALAFVILLTLVVRLARLRVRGEMDYSRAVGLTVLFVGVVLAVWWFLTRGQIGARIVQPLILPSPIEVLRSFVPLHVEQGLVRQAELFGECEGLADADHGNAEDHVVADFRRLPCTY